MTDKNKKTDDSRRLTEDERFKYVGFDVHPGKIKDLFKTDAEKDKFVKAVVEKRSGGGILRDECTLTEERVTFGERIILTVVSLIIIGALFMPWYSAYTEVVEGQEAGDHPVETVVDTALTGEGIVEDSAAVMAAVGDQEIVTDTTPTSEVAAVADTLTGRAADSAASAASLAAENEGTEIIHGLQATVKVHREIERASGIGGLLSLGSAGSYLFSSGIVLILTAVIFLLYTLVSIGLPALTLYTLWGAKVKGDDQAIMLKKYLKLNWLPVLGFVLVVILAFFGADYGFDPTGMYTSIGTEYGVGVLFDSLSWGLFVTVAGFILMAAKGSEI